MRGDRRASAHRDQTGDAKKQAPPLHDIDHGGERSAPLHTSVERPTSHAVRYDAGVLTSNVIQHCFY